MVCPFGRPSTKPARRVGERVSDFGFDQQGRLHAETGLGKTFSALKVVGKGVKVVGKGVFKAGKYLATDGVKMLNTYNEKMREEIERNREKGG